ncbi:hypothetical protein [Rhizobium leguminosarum]
MPTLRLDLFYLCEHDTSAVQMPRKFWLISTMIAKQSRPKHVTNASAEQTAGVDTLGTPETKSERSAWVRNAGQRREQMPYRLEGHVSDKTELAITDRAPRCPRRCKRLDGVAQRPREPSHRSSSTTEINSFFIMPPMAFTGPVLRAANYVTLRLELLDTCENATSAMPVPHKLWFIAP